MEYELKDQETAAHVVLLETKTEYSGAIFQVKNDQVRFQNGDIAWRQYIVHDNAVAIVPLRLVQGKLQVLLIRQYRHPTRNIFWEIPAGLRDIAGETPVSAAQRELLEETGLEAEVWEPLVSYFPSPGCSDEKVQLYAALNPRESAEAIDFQREAEEAELAAQWWDLAEVCSAIFRGSLCSSVVVAGILAVSANSQEWIAKLQ